MASHAGLPASIWGVQWPFCPVAAKLRACSLALLSSTIPSTDDAIP